MATSPLQIDQEESVWWQRRTCCHVAMMLVFVTKKPQNGYEWYMHDSFPINKSTTVIMGGDSWRALR